MIKSRLFPVALILILAAFPVQARYYYVKTTGLNTLQGTNWATAWQTIGYAATNAASGDIVIVSNGVYSEEVVPQKSGVIFTSLNRYQSVIIGAQNCFNVVDRSNVQITGFVLKKGGTSGINIAGSSALNVIMNNQIHSNSVNGVFINSDAADNNTIISNDIRNCGSRGVYLFAGDNNAIRGNRLHHQSYGILLDNTATYNYIAGNRAYSNSSGGMYLQNSSVMYNSVLSNEMWGAAQPYGLSCGQADYNIFRLNIIHNHQQYGVRLVGSATYNSFIRNTIYSNDAAGVFIPDEGADNNFILSNDIWGANQDECVWIAEGDNNIIRGNHLRRAANCGVYLDNMMNLGTTGNIIAGNSIYSNGLFGIRLVDNYIDDNVFSSNDIFRNGTWGLWNGAGDRTVIRDNRFRNNFTGGIGMTFDARSNYISGNRICSNAQYGIQLDHDSCEWNMIQNNTLLGPGQQTGVHLGNSDQNSVEGNSLLRNTYGGLLLDGDAVSNMVCNNILSNNTTVGLYINDENAKYNAVRSNRFHSQSQAICVRHGDKNLVSRNLVRECTGFGMVFLGTARSNVAAHNTVYRSAGSSGIAFIDSASGFIVNNIILSNGDLGITNSSTEPVMIDYNCLYGNVRGAANTGVVLGAHNTYLDPLINTLFNFTLSSSSSPACDSATNIPFVTDGYFGPAPDMGWRELVYTASIPPSTESNLELKMPAEDALVYNNLLDLSGAEPARIVFGKAGNAEISIYNIRGVLVKSWPLSAYAAGDYREWDGTVGESGKKAGAGVYFVLIKGDINKKLKLIIKK